MAGGSRGASLESKQRIRGCRREDDDLPVLLRALGQRSPPLAAQPQPTRIPAAVAAEETPPPPCEVTGSRARCHRRDQRGLGLGGAVLFRRRARLARSRPSRARPPVAAAAAAARGVNKKSEKK
uniref:Uncharacterized protein n=1 Tax=Arundo donax TaxID=35708 RepID=A0A0A9TXX1_ARUDO